MRSAYRLPLAAHRAVDMQTITISLYGLLNTSMGLESTGIDYFVDGGQGCGSNKLIHAEKRKKIELRPKKGQ